MKYLRFLSVAIAATLVLLTTGFRSPGVRITATLPDIQSAYHAAISADVAGTVVLPDGRILWLAGDAVSINGQSVWDPHNEFVTQASPGSTSFTVLKTAAGQWQQVPNWSNGDVFWFAAGAVDNGVLHVFGERVTLGTTAWSITVDGYYDATFSLPDLAFQSIIQIPVSVSSVAQGTGGWWLVGTDPYGPVPPYCAPNCYSAHATWAATGHLGDYSGWATDRYAIPGTTGIGGVVSLIRDADGGWTAWSKTTDIMGTTIERLNSAHVETGVWTVTGTWTAPSGTTYGVQVHPGEGEPAGTDLVTVIENDSTYYGPWFLELPEH